MIIVCTFFSLLMLAGRYRIYIYLSHLTVKSPVGLVPAGYACRNAVFGVAVSISIPILRFIAAHPSGKPH